MKVILHIGGSKCGSSAIQAYLRQNEKALAQKGVAIPGRDLDFSSEVSGEQIWFFENAVAQHDLSSLGQKLSEAANTAEKNGHHTMIVSAENICNHADLAIPLKDAIKNRPVKVVFYVRRQDDFLISGWQQWHLKQFDSLRAFLADRVGRVGNWYEMICPWADAFGDDNVSVRPFVKERLTNGDVVADFFDQIGISQDGMTPLTRKANPSFDEALARIAHRVRDVFEGQHDNRFYEVMVRLLGPAAFKTGSASSLMDHETRERILSRYQEDNTALKARFLPELGNQPLFHPLKADDVIAKSDTEKMSDELAMLTKCIYALAQRTESECAR